MCKISALLTKGKVTSGCGSRSIQSPKGAAKLAPTLPVADDQLRSDNFMMYGLKVIRCTQPGYHDWHQCPFAHPDEKVARRDPRIYQYTGIVCPAMKKKRHCNLGDKCLFAHNVFEYWLHPTRYRTVMCSDGANCERTFCFFAHAPEELRGPELAVHVKPGEAVQHAKQELNPAEDTAGKIQANSTIPDNLTLLLDLASGDIKEALPAEQAGFSDKYAQQEPPSGEDSSSTCDPAVRATACGGSTGAKRLREPALDASSLDLDKPLTPLQLATYLAGFAHAMGLNFDAAAALLQWQQLPPQPLQPHIGASVPFAAQPAGPFDVIKCQQSLLQTAESGLPWGDADDCSSPYGVPKPTSLPETSPVIFNLFAACSGFLSKEMPAKGVLDKTWGVQTLLERVATHSWESARAPFPIPYPGCDQYTQQPDTFDWGATTPRSASAPFAAQPTGSFDMMKCQKSLLETAESGLPWADADGCSSPYRMPDFMSLSETSSVTLNPFAASSESFSTELPADGLLDNTWGAQIPLERAATQSWECTQAPFPFPYPGCDQYTQQPDTFDWGATIPRLQPRRISLVCGASASPPAAALDPLIDFHGSALFSHAAPFSHLQHSGLVESPSRQNRICPMF